jgi:hypothetical protein
MLNLPRSLSLDTLVVLLLLIKSEQSSLQPSRVKHLPVEVSLLMDTMTFRLPMIEWMGTVPLEPSITPQILTITQSTSSQVKMILPFLHLTKDNKKRSMRTTQQTLLSSQTQTRVIILMTILSKMVSIIITEVLSMVSVAFHQFLI